MGRVWGHYEVIPNLTKKNLTESKFTEEIDNKKRSFIGSVTLLIYKIHVKGKFYLWDFAYKGKRSYNFVEANVHE